MLNDMGNVLERIKIRRPTLTDLLEIETYLSVVSDQGSVISDQ
jgi:hypothetical protein